MTIIAGQHTSVPYTVNSTAAMLATVASRAAALLSAPRQGAPGGLNARPMGAKGASPAPGSGLDALHLPRVPRLAPAARRHLLPETLRVPVRRTTTPAPPIVLLRNTTGPESEVVVLLCRADAGRRGARSCLGACPGSVTPGGVSALLCDASRPAGRRPGGFRSFCPCWGRGGAETPQLPHACGAGARIGLPLPCPRYREDKERRLDAAAITPAPCGLRGQPKTKTPKPAPRSTPA